MYDQLFPLLTSRMELQTEGLNGFLLLHGRGKKSTIRPDLLVP